VNRSQPASSTQIEAFMRGRDRQGQCPRFSGRNDELLAEIVVIPPRLSGWPTPDAIQAWKPCVDSPKDVATPPNLLIDDPVEAGNSSQWLEEHSAADVTFTPEGVLLEYNAVAERMFRVPPGVDMRGKDVLCYVAQPERLATLVAAVQLTGRIENWDCEFRRMDGTPLHSVVNLVGNFDARRELKSLRAHIFNITEWRRGHERALFGHRAEALGRLAGGVAHDFNNLLTVIMGHAERLLLAAGEGPLRPSVSAILDSSARAATLTRQLLAFGRRQVLQPRTVQLNDLLTTVEDDVRRTFGRRIVVEVDFEPSLGLVRVDPEQIEDVISALSAHGVDAMPKGGTLAFRTRHARIGADRPMALCFVQPGSYVQVEVRHTGIPLDHETQMRLFEPFYPDAGPWPKGLQLAAAFGVVKQSGGYIWVDSAPGAATTFTLLFPVQEPADAAVAPPVVGAAAAAPDATILVVDDEDLVRRFIGDALRASGYEVIEAAAAEEAERLVASRSEPVHLVVADVNLGGVTGPQLGARLRRGTPDLRLLYISGHEDTDHIGRAPHTSFLQKPFAAALFIQRVRELLGA
jgi:signal transduction histidine kinase/CheY-like chemotaxis protein